MKAICKCGSRNFIVTEVLVWKAYADDDGEVDAFNKSCDIDSIHCKDCNADLTEEFKEKEININFQ
jgi:hypothetical protein